MRKSYASKREPITALINIVFLILIFFMVAGTLSGSVDKSLEFVRTSDLECCSTPDALFITSDGRFILNGAPIETLSTYVGQLEHDQKKAQLAPDKKLPAKRLLELVSELQSLGAKQIVIMTENESQ